MWFCLADILRIVLFFYRVLINSPCARGIKLFRSLYSTPSMLSLFTTSIAFYPFVQTSFGRLVHLATSRTTTWNSPPFLQSVDGLGAFPSEERRCFPSFLSGFGINAIHWLQKYIINIITLFTHTNRSWDFSFIYLNPTHVQIKSAFLCLLYGTIFKKDQKKDLNF